ncbi:hypothetical protein K1719_027519 [Acacia pycnantha]|nr:hypothetical protein K1719_027519 [Acacia pycnantha]
MMMLGFASQMCLIVWVLLCAVRLNTISCCHESDRSLLLMFKEGVVDPSNRLSSWSSLQDCCQWEGVLCDVNNRIYYIDLSSDNQTESLRGEINLSSLLALQFLETLALDSNDFERISMPSINNSVVATHHTHLLPNSSSNLFDLSLSNNINLHIDNLHYWLSRIPSLESLGLSGIHLSSETSWAHSLASLPLKSLSLYDCNLTSSILSLEYANFSSLSYLDLGHNDFTYGLPNWLFNLSKDNLSDLLLSGCNLRGQITDFSDYRNLEWLDLSNNRFKGSIPHWLGQLDTLTHLNLSNNSFHGSVPSNLLLNASYLIHLNIRFNDLTALPKILGQNNSPAAFLNLFMSFNKFKGQLPQVSNVVQALDLSYNYFSGNLSSLLCQTETNQNHVFKYLDLSNNYLTDELPECRNNWTSLFYLFLGNNQLVGQVPPTMGSSLYNSLRVLDLHNNGFSGDMPWTFHNCTVLVLLNLEGNNFSGSIQTWIPQSVQILKLRSNHFSGNIPPQLCSLSSLIVLDLANNTLSGSIPHCLHINTSLAPGYLGNFLTIELADRTLGHAFIYSQEFMKIDLQTKGQRLEYEKNLKLVRSIDLSANKLTGEIPVQLFKLTKLQSLNLSYNYLVGEIPEQIIEMKDLESLDFSYNSLHGKIPQSMSGLTFLSVLNLSYNHFNGQIPLGTQLQSFDAWSYTGNPELCGAPLQKNCTIPATRQSELKEMDDNAFLKSLYLGMGVGFAVGFWIVCGSLFLNREWRHTYFRFFDGMIDRIYVIVAIRLRRFC